MSTNTLLNRPANSDLKAFDEFVKSRKGVLAKVAARHLNPDRIVRLVALNVSRTPALSECTVGSILASVIKAAELGLEPGSATGEAYLVPFSDKGVKKCQLIPGYRGLISLAMRSGLVLSVSAKVVYQGDQFDYEDGLNPVLRHIPNFDSKREPNLITFAYCVVRLKDGGYLYDVMTRTEIDAIRARSKAGSFGPWVTDYAEMARKTVCRRCLKYAPMSVELSKALSLDEAVETGEAVDLGEFEGLEAIEAEAVEKPTKADGLKDRIPGLEGGAK